MGNSKIEIESGSGMSMNIGRPHSYLFKPKPDITAYELALCVEVMFSNMGNLEHRLDEGGIRRHFEEIAY